MGDSWFATLSNALEENRGNMNVKKEHLYKDIKRQRSDDLTEDIFSHVKTTDVITST